MEEHSYQIYQKKYIKRVRAIYTFALLFGVCMSVFSGAFFHHVWIGVMLFVSCLVLILTMHMLQKTDDAYFSAIVSDIAELIDVLTELEEQEIFPANEDTLLSKLQSKIQKLVHMLKFQNEKEQMEHENIKGLVSDLSHQLKTPISNLRMYTEFLKRTDISKEERDSYLNILNLSVERLSFLSESMIKISRLESGLITLDCKVQSINDTILKAVKDIYAGAKQAGIVVSYEEECKCDILHDSRWTAEALFNLLDNAVKYGKPGNEIRISIRKLGALLEIAVKDENEIIPEQERTRLFERFYRGKNAGQKEGVGIGLYLAREIIEKQGGYVSVREWGRGNQFTIVMQK